MPRTATGWKPYDIIDRRYVVAEVNRVGRPTVVRRLGEPVATTIHIRSAKAWRQFGIVHGEYRD